MDADREKIELIKSLDPNAPDVSAQRGLCRFEPGEDARLRRAKEEKVAESSAAPPPARPPAPPHPPAPAAQRPVSLDGYVPAQLVHDDGEYIATRQEGTHSFHCIAWRDHGQWRRLSDWSEQMPESATPHAEILFAPQAAHATR